MTQTECAAVSFTGAVKTFGTVRAVDGVDLAIAPGETVALLGRNGAGKSTTISLLLGLNEPDEGTVELFGTPPEASVRAGRVGAMLQEGRAVPRVTVRELVTFVARRYPAPPADRNCPAGGAARGLVVQRPDVRVRFAVALAGNRSLAVSGSKFRSPARPERFWAHWSSAFASWTATRILSVVRAGRAESLTIRSADAAGGDGEALDHRSGGAGAPHAGTTPRIPDRTATLPRSPCDAASLRADHHTIELNRRPGRDGWRWPSWGRYAAWRSRRPRWTTRSWP